MYHIYFFIAICYNLLAFPPKEVKILKRLLFFIVVLVLITILQYIIVLIWQHTITSLLARFL
ncbi:MAG TPA: hypothetical protein DEQ96_03050 [Fusobacterium sp.]|uniref:Uncharacterized protein n=1 Tax=Fusobacterium nucleatum TaxID=851 RepID=A0A323TYL0_FUSNU|nr:hypothetical protein DNF10_03150 [Fusobacterium nucleatum]HCE32084.1 hypothetical protein [Fusobacterium sp.]